MFGPPNHCCTAAQLLRDHPHGWTRETQTGRRESCRLSNPASVRASLIACHFDPLEGKVVALQIVPNLISSRGSGSSMIFTLGGFWPLVIGSSFGWFPSQISPADFFITLGIGAGSPFRGAVHVSGNREPMAPPAASSLRSGRRRPDTCRMCLPRYASGRLLLA